MGELPLALGHRPAPGELVLAPGGDHAGGVRRVPGGLRGVGPGGRGVRGSGRDHEHGPRRVRATADDAGQLLGQGGRLLPRGVVGHSDGPEGLEAAGRARGGVLGDDPRDEVLAQVGAQVGQGPGVLRGDQDPHRDGVLVGVGDLHRPRAPIPQIGLGQERLDLAADEVHGGAPIEFEFDRAQLGGGAPRPVLEGRGREVGARGDEAAFVPDPDHDVTEGDLLHGTVLALRTRHDHVAHADGVGERQQDAREHVAEGLLGRQACDDRDEAGGGEDRRHRLAGGFESAQDRAQADDADHHLHEAPDDLGLRLEAARAPLVLLLPQFRRVLDHPRGRVAHPRQARERGDEQQVGHDRHRGAVRPVHQVDVGQGHLQADPPAPREEGAVGRGAGAAQQGRGDGRLRQGAPCDGVHQDRDDQPDEGADGAAQQQRREIEGVGDHFGGSVGLPRVARRRQNMCKLGWKSAHGGSVCPVPDYFLKGSRCVRGHGRAF